MVRGENKRQACDAPRLDLAGSTTLSVTDECRRRCGDSFSIPLNDGQVCSLVHTARIVFSSKIDGSGSLDCRIFGRLRPVRIVRKRAAMPHQSADRTRRQIVLDVEFGTIAATAARGCAHPGSSIAHVDG
jgi:hypothetical protein